jgi:uncharacterized protein
MHWDFSHLTTLQWAFLALGAFSVGISKTGIPGLGIVSVVIFSLILPPAFATGAALMVLICADVLAITIHRKTGDFKQILRLMPWTVAGIVLGAFFFQQLKQQEALLKQSLGALLFIVAGLALWRRMQKELPELPKWAAPLTGLGAGFTTMVANAAGPVSTLYLLAMRLPKAAFLGTAAWFFFFINWIKVPIGVGFGMISLDSLKFAIWLFPAAILGALVGKPLGEKLDQKRFEVLALTLTFLGSFWMLAGKWILQEIFNYK